MAGTRPSRCSNCHDHQPSCLGACAFGGFKRRRRHATAFFAKGQTITSQVYLDVLQSVVHPWMVRVSAGRPYVFQQDGAPAHNSRLVQNWCDENMDMFWSKDFWPPSSPDLNPLDYYCWGVIERESNKRAHNSIDSLRASIIDVCRNTDRQHLANACNRFRSRIEAVIESGGGHFE